MAPEDTWICFEGKSSEGLFFCVFASFYREQTWNENRVKTKGGTGKARWENKVPGTNEQAHATPLYSYPVTALTLYRISLRCDSRGSAMTNHKKLIDVTPSLDRDCLPFTKEKI